MPLTKAAKKALRQSLRHKKTNSVYKNKTKDLLKEAKLLISQNKAAEAKKLLPAIFKAIDKAAKVGIFKKNTASRKKSGISKLIK